MRQDMVQDGHIRRRVLIAAYACGPGEGSEPGAGWAFAEAAAVHSEVWVITRERFRENIMRMLQDDRKLARWLHPVFVDLPDTVLRMKRHHRDVYWYYPLWQYVAGRTALRLHEHHDFDVAHHVTFAVDWMPCGLTALPTSVPLIWGPVGGATNTPVSMYAALGVRGVAIELVRRSTGSSLRRIFGDRVAARATLVVALNEDVRRRFERHGRAIVEANAALAASTPVNVNARDVSGAEYRAVFIGRLVSWKGTRLALNAISADGNERWRLDYFGEGPERRWIEHQIHKRGLSDRVRLHGNVPRTEVFRVMQKADLLLFPSMHDSAPWTVAESSTLGLPSLILDLGGPAQLAGDTGIVVRSGPNAADHIAKELVDYDRAGSRIGTNRWSVRRLPALLEEWYGSVAETAGPQTGRAAKALAGQEAVFP